MTFQPISPDEEYEAAYAERMRDEYGRDDEPAREAEPRPAERVIALTARSWQMRYESERERVNDHILLQPINDEGKSP